MVNGLEDVFAVFIPIVLFIAIAVVFCARAYFGHRSKQAVQQTERTAIEQGQQLTPEILERLGQSPQAKNADLRRGVISIGIGLGIAAFGALVGEEDAVRPLLAIASLPLLVGVAYVGLWKYGQQK